MSESPRLASPPEGLTYRIALGLLLFAGLAQFGAWAWISLPRPASAAGASMAGASGLAAGEGGAVSSADKRVPAISDLALAIPEDVPRDMKLTGEGPQLTPEQFVLRTALEFVQLARAARKRGDMEVALNKLREAQALVPDNAEILAELATTFETMGLFDKSSAHWDAVKKLGSEKAGMYYRIAADKLSQGVGDPLAGSGQTSQDTQASLDKIRSGARLLIDGVTAEKKTQADAATDVDLVLALKTRAGAALEIRDVKIQVYFYDTLDDQHVVLTNAEVSSEWQTAPPDWSDGEIEKLSVHYHQEGVELSSEAGQERRKYLGYIIRLYYKGALQDSVAEPSRLIELFPPPVNLSL